MDHVPVEPISPHTIIERDLNCISCGYNLRSRTLDQVCPECGQAVERSVLVLPMPEATAAAIRLAAWALLIGLLLLCIKANFVGALIMMIAIYRLHYRCALEHMQGLGKYIKWLWMTTVVANIGNLLSGVLFVFILGSLFSAGGMNATWTSSTGSTTVSQTAEGQVRTIKHSATGCTVEEVKDDQGVTFVRVIDTSGKKTVLLEEQAVTLPAGNGGQLVVTLTTEGKVAIVAPNFVTHTVDPSTGAVLKSTSGAAITLPATIDWLASLAGIVAVFLYLIVCRELALRARDPGLAGQFKTLMWFMIIGAGGMIISGVVALAVWSFAAGGFLPIMLIAALAGIAWLIASIWQISASFRLSTTLRLVPRTVDDVVGRV